MIFSENLQQLADEIDIEAGNIRPPHPYIEHLPTIALAIEQVACEERDKYQIWAELITMPDISKLVSRFHPEYKVGTQQMQGIYFILERIQDMAKVWINKSSPVAQESGLTEEFAALSRKVWSIGLLEDYNKRDLAFLIKLAEEVLPNLIFIPNQGTKNSKMANILTNPVELVRENYDNWVPNYHEFIDDPQRFRSILTNVGMIGG